MKEKMKRRTGRQQACFVNEAFNKNRQTQEEGN